MCGGSTITVKNILARHYVQKNIITHFRLFISGHSLQIQWISVSSVFPLVGIKGENFDSENSVGGNKTSANNKMTNYIIDAIPRLSSIQNCLINNPQYVFVYFSFCLALFYDISFSIVLTLSHGSLFKVTL